MSEVSRQFTHHLSLIRSEQKVLYVKDLKIQGETKTVVRIRLRRIGATKKPFYRIVVANQQAPRNGGFIENIGTYDPNTSPETVNLQPDRASYWLGVGAQPSESVARLLKNASLIDAAGKYIAPPQSAEAAAAA